MAMIHLSEDDFHQIFAEAIEAGHIDSPDGPEISTGLLDISADSANIPKWYSDPKFSRFIVHKSSSSGDQKRQTKAASIQERLSTCCSEADVLQVVKGMSASTRFNLTYRMADFVHQRVWLLNCARFCNYRRLMTTSCRCAVSTSDWIHWSQSTFGPGS